MKQRLQPAPLARIGKYQMPQFCAIEAAIIIQDICTEMLGDALQRWLPRFHYGAAGNVRVDTGNTERRETICSRGFSAANTPGKAN